MRGAHPPLDVGGAGAAVEAGAGTDVGAGAAADGGAGVACGAFPIDTTHPGPLKFLAISAIAANPSVLVMVEIAVTPSQETVHVTLPVPPREASTAYEGALSLKFIVVDQVPFSAFGPERSPMVP